MAMNKQQNDTPPGDDPLVSILEDDSPVDPMDEQLVAYLDGELSPEERGELESRLGRDAVLRRRLRTLQRGWDMLDELPMATPSAVLLESTIRMAAMEASRGPMAHAQTRWPRWVRSRRLWIATIALACFGMGVGGARLQQHYQFRRQLTELPIAMHLDAYLNASDLSLMRTLMDLPQWNKAVEIAERFGEWDFALHHKIDRATVTQRKQLLRELPIEHQQVVMQSWQRYEKLEPTAKANVVETARRVSDQGDSAELLETMDRFARWRETLAPTQRDQIATGEVANRIRAIEESLQRTTRQWTQQTSRLLSDEDIETIYHVVRQIARLRIERLDLSHIPAATGLRLFGSKDQIMDSRTEAIFLRRMFDPNPPPPPPSPSPAGERPSEPRGFDFMSQALAIRPLLDQLRGPLHDNELWMIESVLGDELTEFLSAASEIESLREELLRSWTDESLRRIEFRRSGRTISERYELTDPATRDVLDLLPPDKILESLRNESPRRRP